MDSLPYMAPYIEDESSVSTAAPITGAGSAGDPGEEAPDLSSAAPTAPSHPSSCSTNEVAQLPSISADNNAPTPSHTPSFITTQLYSPTRAEIESHPILQRKSLVRENVATGLGTAQEEVETQRREPEASQQARAPQAHTMGETEIKEGDQVSWQWSGSRPGGKATDVVKEGEAKVTSKKGNEIKKNADPEDPAVKISRSGNDVVKRAHELDVEEPGDKHKEKAGEEKEVTEEDKKEAEEEKEDKAEEKEDEKEENGEAQAGDKRKADEAADADEKEDKEEAEAKKQKTGKESEANGEKEAPKKKGRPAKKGANGEAAAPKKETKKREAKKAATESGEPRRSGRNASKSS